MVIALINSKGGVAKTTSTVNLGAALARELREKHRVLVIDLDSQASAALSLGIGRDELEPSIASALIDGESIAATIRSTAVAGLDVIPGSMRLMSADVNLSTADDPQGALRAAIQPIAADYDFVLIDCPPSLSLLSVNALIAADALIVPVVPEYLAIEGLANLLEAVERVRESFDVPAPLLGILLTRVDYRTRAATDYVAELRRHFGGDVFRTEIRVSARLAEAPSAQMAIFDYDHNSNGAVAYRDLAAEVITRKNTSRKAGRRADGKASKTPKRGGR